MRCGCVYFFKLLKTSTEHDRQEHYNHLHRPRFLQTYTDADSYFPINCDPLFLFSVFGFRERHEHLDHLHRPRFLHTHADADSYFPLNCDPLFLFSVFGLRERHEHLDHLHRPRFLQTQTNFTYHKGETATLFCSVEDLGTKTVSKLLSLERIKVHIQERSAIIVLYRTLLFKINRYKSQMHFVFNICNGICKP